MMKGKIRRDRRCRGEIKDERERGNPRTEGKILKPKKIASEGFVAGPERLSLAGPKGLGKERIRNDRRRVR